MDEVLKTLRRIIRNAAPFSSVTDSGPALTSEAQRYIDRRGGQGLIGKLDVLVLINYALGDTDALRKIAEEE